MTSIIKQEKQSIKSLEDSFQEMIPIYKALEEEAVFIITKMLQDGSIKIHQIEHRTKEITSLKKKIQSGSYQNIDSVTDIVGVRVICLFKSDLENIGKLIGENFLIFDIEDKIDKSDDTFGYMSVHYECEIKSQYTGPRYDAIRGIRFEIQVGVYPLDPRSAFG